MTVAEENRSGKPVPIRSGCRQAFAADCALGGLFREVGVSARTDLECDRRLRGGAALRGRSLSPRSLGDDPKPRITITVDAEQRQLMIEDNGIGMSREELIESLGTIARSGTKAFIDRLGSSQRRRGHGADPGRFGVGFYSAFMVAEKVEVFSRRAGSETAHVWSSDGKGAFAVAVAEAAYAPRRGTRVVLHLMEDAKSYTEKSYTERATIRAACARAIGPCAGADRDRREAGRGSCQEITDGAALWAEAEIFDHARRLYRLLSQHCSASSMSPRSPFIFTPKAGTITHVVILRARLAAVRSVRSRPQGAHQALLRVLAAKGTDLQLCAPTGRAAKRMTEATGYEAKTIHRLLEVDPKVRRFSAAAKDNPLGCDLLVVDETSMVDVLPLIQALLKAVPRQGGALSREATSTNFPSVGPGQVLADIISSGAVPVVRLTEACFGKPRRAGSLPLPIALIRAPIPDLSPPGTGKPTSISCRRTIPETAVARIVELTKTRIPKRFGLDPIRDIQVLCPMNRGGVGARSLNIELQAVAQSRGRRKG